MAVSYSPSNDSIPGLPWNITYLVSARRIPCITTFLTGSQSQRDVALPLPINYLTESGIALTAACFAHGVYEDYAAAQCLSNLLAVGFRRFDVDLYWDADRSLWSLCPVQVPLGNLTAVVSGTLTASISTTQTSTTDVTSLLASVTSLANSGSTLHARSLQNVPRETLGPGENAVNAAQTSTTSMLPSKTTYTLTPTTSGNNTYLIAPTVAAGNTDEILYSIGPYTCTSTIDINTLMTVLREYINDSDNTLEAFLEYFIFNLHAVASAFRPTAPAPAPRASLLPDTANLVGNVVGNTLASSLYTPKLLEQQRSNLNTSWYDAQSDVQPLSAYFTTESGKSKIVSTPDGWPDESFLELGLQRRILLAFGSVDPQMSGYNFSADSNTMFDPGYIVNLINVTMSPSGMVAGGCIFDSASSSLSAANSSWAVTTDTLSSTLPDQASTSYNTSLTSIASLTACGIAPMLNQTLANTTADSNILPYRQFAYSSVWSWAYNEPIGDNDVDDVRCAVVNLSLEGRWQAVPCTQRHHAACQLDSSPHVWTISSTSVQYETSTEETCPQNYTFATPRTSLENGYLLEAFRRSGYSNQNTLWINFNSLDVQSCWVVGVSTTCPYTSSDNDQELVTVPTIAAVIVLIIAGLLILVKCGANRRNSKRSRRGQDGWDYEGVPS